MASWERDFRLWHYSISHSTLLLRSLSGDRSPRRVDLAFFGVRAMHLRDQYDLLSIAPTADMTQLKVISITRAPTEPLLCYVINGGPDYIIATDVAWHEDDGDHGSPSRFGPLRGTS